MAVELQLIEVLSLCCVCVIYTVTRYRGWLLGKCTVK